MIHLHNCLPSVTTGFLFWTNACNVDQMRNASSELTRSRLSMTIIIESISIDTICNISPKYRSNSTDDRSSSREVSYVVSTFASVSNKEYFFSLAQSKFRNHRQTYTNTGAIVSRKLAQNSQQTTPVHFVVTRSAKTVKSDVPNGTSKAAKATALPNPVICEVCSTFLETFLEVTLSEISLSCLTTSQLHSFQPLIFSINVSRNTLRR